MILSDIKAIFVFNNTDVWFAADAVFHWDGTSSVAVFSYNNLTPSGLQPGINKLWGTSSSDLYGVGNAGAIVHYNGSSWSKIESGTNMNIIDIWGDKNPFTGKTEIICGAYNQIPRSESDIIRSEEHTSELQSH